MTLNRILNYITVSVLLFCLVANVILLAVPSNTDDKTSLFSTAAIGIDSYYRYQNLREDMDERILNKCSASIWEEDACLKRVTQRLSVLFNYPIYSFSIKLFYAVGKKVTDEFCRQISIGYAYGELFIYFVVLSVFVSMCFLRDTKLVSIMFLFAMVSVSPYLVMVNLYDLLYIFPKFTDIKDTFLTTYPRCVLGLVFVLQTIAFLCGKTKLFLGLSVVTPFIHAGQSLFGNMFFLLVAGSEILLKKDRLKQNWSIILGLVMTIIVGLTYTKLFYFQSTGIQVTLNPHKILNYLRSWMVIIPRYFFLGIIGWVSYCRYINNSGKRFEQRLLLMSFLALLFTEFLRIVDMFVAFNAIKLFYLIRRIEASSNLIYYVLVLFFFMNLLYEKLVKNKNSFNGNLSFSGFVCVFIGGFLILNTTFSVLINPELIKKASYNVRNIDKDLCLYYEREGKSDVNIHEIDIFQVEPHEEVIFNLGIYNFLTRE